jgi:hypothetical protein
MKAENFKDISIRGRLAFGAVCLENAFRYFNIKSELINNVIMPTIWEFISASDLSKWEQDINYVDPVCYMNSQIKTDYSSLNVKIGELYANLSPVLLDLISDVIEIGTGNIYGGTNDYSPITLKALEKVLDKCTAVGVPLPDITLFKKSSFGEAHGWGNERNRNFFLA